MKDENVDKHYGFWATKSDTDLVKYLVQFPADVQTEVIKVELSIRHIRAIKALNKSTAIANWIMILLTICISLLTVVMVVRR